MENFVLGLILGGVTALLVYSATSNSSLPNIFNREDSIPYRNPIDELWEEMRYKESDLYEVTPYPFGNVTIPTMNIEEDEASNEELIEPKVYKEKYLEW